MKNKHKHTFIYSIKNYSPFNACSIPRQINVDFAKLISVLRCTSKLFVRKLFLANLAKVNFPVRAFVFAIRTQKRSEGLIIIITTSSEMRVFRK
jgi:hypothetical protein